MKLAFVATLANRATELEFRAMERSLREIGCRLPIRVIPYDEDVFQLPAGSEWWIDTRLFSALGNAHPMYRKYLTLFEENYQFVDTDCIFVENPENALIDHHGFVASCGHWRCATHCVTAESERLLRERTTMWQRNLFCGGQFACDRPLYADRGLLDIMDRHEFTRSSRHHDQPGLNFLVAISGVPFTNLTLPPHEIESTWAGDYPGEYLRYWTDARRRPYLIHWAGTVIDGSRPIDDLFLSRLSPDERRVFDRAKVRKLSWWKRLQRGWVE